MGPLFFILYINDLPNCLQQTIPRLFADDTNLTASGETIGEIEVAMNLDLECVKKWLISNKSSLNVAKTEFLLIGTRYKLNNTEMQPYIKIDNESIRQVFESKILGVKIDQFLSWDNHVDHIAKKISSGIAVIKRLKFIVDKDTLILVYNAIVKPHFDYCSEVWDTLGLCNSKRLQKLQNRAARVIMNMDNDVHHLEALSALNWDTLEIQRLKTKAKSMYKVLNDQAPVSLKSLFIKKSEITDYNLRGSTTSLQLPLPRTECLKRSFSYSGAKIWNSLPSELRESKSFFTFKRKIAAHNGQLHF